jgi:hypothetical protein
VRKISTTKAFAALVEGTLSGKIRWPMTPEQKAELAAEVAESAARAPVGDAYGRWLASGNDWLSRKRREHPEAFAKADDDEED